jgi:hypothetical protein
MSVHKDFILYGSGIYARTFQVSGQTLGHHSVKILGWGSENEEDYWVRQRNPITIFVVSLQLESKLLKKIKIK